ncbi:hypothetical protein DRJ17_03205 [Candidatus Woesearchaeota archaeon]|nr:MAG: hypothetical protein DRJ17_03205 [Candidatus Woesearchaeota archaeon]
MNPVKRSLLPPTARKMFNATYYMSQPGSRRGYGYGRGLGSWSNITLPSIPPPPASSLRVVVSVDEDKGLNSRVSFRFARAPFFLIVDIVGKKPTNVKVISNTMSTAPRGVGAAVGQWLINIGARIVVGPHFGPNISMILSQAGIEAREAKPGVTALNVLKELGLMG